MDESRLGPRRGPLAEATDVIGSQSRQEPSGIKHNRYASCILLADVPLCPKPRAFLHCDEARRARPTAANRPAVTKT